MYCVSRLSREIKNAGFLIAATPPHPFPSGQWKNENENFSPALESATSPNKKSTFAPPSWPREKCHRSMLILEYQCQIIDFSHCLIILIIAKFDLSDALIIWAITEFEFCHSLIF